MFPSGLVAALSGLWTTQLYVLPATDGELLYLIRLVVGWGMLHCLVLGLAAIRWRDITRHRAWMMRGYALGMGAGTQALTHLPWILLVGATDEFSRALMMAAGWAINLAVAEWIIHRQVARPLLAAAT